MYAKITFYRRMECGYSQRELADKADLGLKTISRAKGGFDNLSIETYNKIFRALDLSVKDGAEAIIHLGHNEHAATV